MIRTTDADQRYQAIFHQAAVGIARIAPEGRWLEVNEKMCQILGYSEQELLHLSFSDVTHPGDLDVNLRLLKQALDGHTQSYTMDKRYIHKSGSIVWVSLNASLVRGADGKPKYFAVVIQDITELRRIREDLQRKEAHYRQTLKVTKTGSWECNLLTEQVFWSENMEQIWGMPKGSFDGKLETVSASIHPEDLPAWEEDVRACIEDGKEHNLEYRLKLPDGSIRWVLAIGDAERDKQGEAVLLRGLAMDITERKNTQQAVKDSEARLQIAGQVAYDLIYEWDVATDELQWFGNIDNFLGFEHGEISENIEAWLDLIHPDDRQALSTAVELHRTSTQELNYEYRIQQKDGQYQYWSDRALPIIDETGKPCRWIGVCRNITKFKEQQLELERIAHYDNLTKLPNRALLLDRLQQALAYAQRHSTQFAVVFMDLDGFKQINDEHGHDIGDRVLVQVASNLLTAIREEDTIARLGGDEFVAILNDFPPQDEGKALLDRLLIAAATPLKVNSHSLSVSTSIGVTLYPQGAETTVEQLLRQADQAMYLSKLAGKNRYSFYDHEHADNLGKHHKAVQRIAQALQNDEFILHYQPKVNMARGTLIGVEALLRWQHPERGLLEPNHFLPLVHEHAVYAQIGEWVINKAMKQLEIWQLQGFSTPISINIGARQLQSPDFIQLIQSIKARHQSVTTDSIEFEILETNAIRKIDEVSKVMQSCQQMGIRFALDDFGTGYSTLSYLKQLPATQLKVDRSFIRDIMQDPVDLAIVQSILAMSLAFRQQVIAEGVTSEEHGKMLLWLGCEHAQGFFIAQPMTGEDIPRWQANWAPPASWLSTRSLSPTKLAIVISMVEIRSWHNELQWYLEGRRPHPPALGGHDCRFGQWLLGDAKQLYAGHADYQTLEHLYAELQRYAGQVHDARKKGHHGRLDSALQNLANTKEILLSHLSSMVR
ncbi:EAL domain-containing protein [Ferrimonas sp. YFM]|uniref:EAL domain-containing protein n=1 Tax=Ferrimonas sp. YFM TaxID=3028878 RepID=UPI0025722F4C|nr:EAL domain-containing protein [Ferrimonas sp. YFM]BDY05738.1 hypothetical protein F0521_27790 [Ferrimonas sp. YFM]